MEENCGQDARRRFKLSEADQCMLYKEYEKGVCIIIFYIDDMLIIGKEEAIDDAIRVMLDPERVNAQSHSTIPRLPQISQREQRN